MTIAVTDLVSGNNGVVQAATYVLTVPAGGVPAGALICLAVQEEWTSGSSPADVGTLADTAGNTYVKIGSTATITSGWKGALFYVKNCAALVSGNTITYTLKSANNAVSMSVLYATGIDTTAPLDTAVTTQHTGSGSGGTTTSGTPAVSGELFVTAFFNQKSGYTIDSGNGWATPFTYTRNGNGDGVGGGNQVNNGTGTQTFAPTTGSTDTWNTTIVGFKPAAGASRLPPSIYTLQAVNRATSW